MFSTFKRILKYTKPYSLFMVLGTVFGLIGILLSLLVPVIIGDAVDTIVGKGNVNFEKLIHFLTLIAVTVSASALFQWLMSICANKLAYNTVRDMRFELFAKLNEIPLKYIDSSPRGDLISRSINDIEQVSDGLIQGFTQFFSGSVLILGTFAFMLSINVWIALAVVLLTPISLIAAAFIAKRSTESFRIQAQVRGDLAAFTHDAITGHTENEAFCYDESGKFNKINEDFRTIGIKAIFCSSLLNPCTRFVNNLIYAAVVVLGAFSVIKGNLSVGNLTSFFAYTSQYTKPFNEISAVLAELQVAFSSAKRVFSVLDEKSEPDDSMLPELDGESGNVKFSDVTFSYNKDKPFIQNLSLNAENGRRIAIVGSTGCGKTTLINLLLRFYDIDGGIITVGNQNIAEVTRNSLRNNFGMVLQEPWLFTGTIAENIAFANETASREDIIEAAKKAHAHSFIKKLPKGYDTTITEGELSQGQRQLICIARIMLFSPPILILDEATSSIDLRTEVRIQKAFESLMKNKTSFVIAHRLNTIRNADMIVVMDNGKIAESGTHEELLSKGGFYSRLYMSAEKGESI